MGAAAAPIALGLAVMGTVKGGIDANNAARAESRVDKENARLSLLQGEQQALQTRKDERMQSGDQLAGMGGAGIELGSGSASDVLAANAYQRELEILNIRTQAGRQSDNYLTQARDARKAGRSALIGSLFSAASTAIGGAANIRAQRAGTSPAGTVPRMSVAGAGSGGSFGQGIY